MRIAQTYQSKNALNILRQNGIAQQLESVIDQPNIQLDRGSTSTVKTCIESKLEEFGWLIRMKIDIDLGAQINAFHSSGIAVQVQMGNVARAFYDLMKLQRLRELQMISVGVLVVPMRSAARKVGSNLASFERISEEHDLMFQEQITVPLVIYGIS